MNDFEEVLECLEDFGYTVPQKAAARETFLNMMNEFGATDAAIKAAFFQFLSEKTYGDRVKPSDIIPKLHSICLGDGQDAWDELIHVLSKHRPGMNARFQGWSDPLIKQTKDSMGVDASTINDCDTYGLLKLRERFVTEYKRLISVDGDARKRLWENRVTAVTQMLEAQPEMLLLS